MVRNSGTTAATSGSITVALGRPFGDESAAGVGWTCVVSGNIQCTRTGVVAPGSTLPSITVTGIASLSPPSSVDFSAQVTNASDATSGNNYADVTTAVTTSAGTVTTPAGALRLSVDHSTVWPGEVVHVTAVIEGSGDIVGQSGSVSLQPPPSLTYVASSTVGLSSPTVNPSTGTLLWSVKKLPATGAVTTFTFELVAGVAASSGTVVGQGSLLIGTTEVARDSLGVQVAVPTVSNISISHALVNSKTTFSIFGTNLDPSFTVQLVNGSAQLSSAGVGEFNSGQLVAAFDFTNQPVGVWDLEVTPPGGTTIRLPGVLTLDATAVVQVATSVAGPAITRLNRTTNFYVTVTNNGNSDLYGLPVEVDVPPQVDATFVTPDESSARSSILTTLASAPAAVQPSSQALTEASQVAWPVNPTFATTDTGEAGVTTINRLPPGQSVTIQVATVPHALVPGSITATAEVDHTAAAADGSAYTMASWVAGQIATSSACEGNATACSAGVTLFNGMMKYLEDTAWFGGCESISTSSSIKSCASSVLETLMPLLIGLAFATNPLLSIVAEEAWDLYLCAGLAHKFVDLGASVLSAGSIYLSKSSQTSVFGGAPHDPNDMVGPAGVGTQQFIGGHQLLTYGIDFENQASATLPVQEVHIHQQLDPNLDWNTLQFKSVTISGLQVPLTTVGDAATGTVVVPLNGGTTVTVQATENPATGAVDWYFEGPPGFDDPYAPTPFRDFLPPNATSPQGEGSVAYTVLPRAGVSTGTVISGQAVVYFDEHIDGGSLQTPLVTNTVDAGAPTSSVQALPASESGPFTVAWSGADGPNESGIQNYTIDVSTDGGPFRPWLVGTTDTTATYPAVNGHSYRFLSEAQDAVGNTEPTKTVPDAHTTVSGVDPTVRVTTTSVPNTQVGTAYSTTLAATGGHSPYKWALAAGSGALPVGIKLKKNGILAGKAKTAGIYRFTVQATGKATTGSSSNVGTMTLAIVVS